MQIKTAQDVLAKKVTLARLRKEAVKISKAAGEHIRLYHRKPYRRWTSIERNSKLLAQKVNDILHDLNETDMNGVISDKRRNIDVVVGSLEEIVTSASSCLERIRDVRK